MILISQNITNYDIPIPENSVFRINLAWINSIVELKKLLEIHQSHVIFLDLPVNRTKPPNNKYSLNDIISILENYDSIRYIAISNVETEKDLTEYLKVVPKNITIVPKIESHKGVENIKDITEKLEYKERFVMLDHDDLYSNLLKSNISSGKFSFYVNNLIEFCKSNNITLLRTIGIIFTDENKNVSDYIR
jgi:citrate lyase beta subunit